MNFSWNQTSPLRIDIKAEPRGILVVFGLPFLGIGIWMIIQAFLALGDVVTGRVSLMDNIFGLTLLPLFAVLFLWPGVLLVLGRKSISVDAATGEVAETTSVRFYEWHKRQAFADFKAVRAYEGKASSREIGEIDDENPARQPWCVDLTAIDSKKTRTVGATKEPAQAIQLGKALAALMKLPLVDDTDKDGE